METEKKQYKTPEVSEMGTVEELTQGPRRGGVDAIFGGNGGFKTGS